MTLKADDVCLVCSFCGNVQVPEANADGVRLLGIEAAEDCPVCTGVRLVHGAIERERIRYCAHCRGMLVGMDSFLEIVEEMRSRREAVTYTAHEPDWRDLDRRIRCPQCRTQMDTHPYCGPGNVIIDSCEVCAVNWLDYGELDRIVRAPDPQVAG